MIKDKYINPFTDFGFKHIFGKEENKRFLISFLNDLLELNYKIINISYRNLEKLGLNIIDRKAIFDVYCTDEKNNKFIVELQRSQQKYFKDRSVYYTSFPIQEQSEKGDWDYRLTRIYFIGILEFTFDDMRLKENRDNKDYLTKVQLLYCKDKSVFYDKLTYYYLEMPKFRKKESELATHLDYWLYYLNNLANMTEVPEILKKDDLLQEAFEVAEFLALGKDEQFSYQQDVKARWDNKACLDFATEKGFEQGKEEGMKKSAKAMIKKGLGLDLISEITGISIEDLQKI